MKSLKGFILFIFLNLFCFHLQGFANGQVLITLDMKNVTVKQILEKIERKCEYNVVYSDEDIAHISKDKFVCHDLQLNEVLHQLVNGTDLSYTIKDNTIIIQKKGAIVPQTLKVKGKVTDVNKNPLPGVTIRLKGLNIGVATDMNGEFTLEIPEGTTPELLVSFVGMKSKDVKVGNSKYLNIVLEEQVQELKESVVTGIFARKKEGFTGSAVSVKGDEIKKFSATSVVKALAAIDPGFRIMDNIDAGSDPNRLPDLRLRGQATLPTGGSGESDLISLKGEYSNYPNLPLLILDGFEISLQTMVDMDPDRVESITLLKDAAATAIYGAKAANGVIVIESKLPKEGALNISYGGNVRVEMPDLSAYNLMNAAEKLEAEKRAGFYPDDKSIEYIQTYQEYLREVKRGVNTYWLSQPLRTAVQQRHTISFEGGDKFLRYKLYAGINLTPGVMIGSERRTTTAALDLSYRFKKLRLKNSITLDNAVGDNSPYGSFREYTLLNPYLRKRGENGEIVKDLQRTPMNILGMTVLNPMYNTTFNSMNRTTEFTVRELFRIEYDPFETIKTQLDFSLSKGNGKTEVFKPAQHTSFANVTDPELRGSFSVNNSEKLSYNVGLQVSYNETFGGSHFVTGNTRLTVQSGESNGYGALVTGFPNDKMNNILFGRKYNDKISGSEGTSRSIGWIATLGYSYDFRYSLDFNIRVDGSSQFGKDNRFAPFWSAGARWDLKKESFLKSISVISDLVLRSSFGVTGTQGFAPYQAQQMYSYQNLMKPYYASDGTGCELVGLGNKDLKWQKTNQTNFALELGMFENRFTTRLEYYRKTTLNSLTDISIAPSTGFETISENLGTIRNNGIEVMFGFIPWRMPEKNGMWIVNINGSHNKDKIVKISQALRTMNEQNAAATKNAPLPRYEEGRSQTAIWVVKSLGIDPATGEEIFQRRVSKELTGIWNSSDLMPLGNSEPKMVGNINSTFNYTGWGLNLSFNYRLGGQLYNQTLVDRVENADLRHNADKRVLYDRWQKPGDKSAFKKLSGSASGSATQASSRFIMDENTLRFSSLSLTYRWDTANSTWLKRYMVSSMTAGFTFEDLFYWSTVKQERGLDYPFARRGSFSLNITF